METSADAEKCAWCYRPLPAKEPTPPPTAPAGPKPPFAAREEPPVETAIGQEEFGSLASLGSLARHDTAMFAVLVLMAASCVLSLIRHDWLTLIGGAIVLWGILRWARWAFYVVVVVESLNALLMGAAILLFTGAIAFGIPHGGLNLGLAMVIAAVQLGVAMFTLVVVIIRRDAFA